MAEQPHNIETQIRRDLVKWTRAVAGFTGLLFLANVVANFFIYEQWRVANEAQVDTRSQLRAFVRFTGGAIIITNDKDGNPTFYGFVPTFQNFGPRLQLDLPQHTLLITLTVAYLTAWTLQNHGKKSMQGKR